MHWIEHLFSKGAKLVYVVAPLSVMHVWLENWHEWATAPVAFIDLHETGSAGVREAVRLSNEGFPVICLLNYQMAWQLGYKRVEVTRQGQKVMLPKQVDTALFDVEWDIGILDESTSIKSPSSKVGKFFRAKMRAKTRCRMIMTGSAYTKRPLDVWGQVSFITQKVFEPTYTAFQEHYAIPHPYIRGAVGGYQNIMQLVGYLAECAVMLKKTDVVDLPPFVHLTRHVQINAKSRRVYDEIKNDLYAELENEEQKHLEKLRKIEAKLKDAIPGTDSYQKIAEFLEAFRQVKYVSAEHVFSRTRKFQQITSGFVIPDREEDTPDVPAVPVRLGTEKVDELMDILDERDGLPTVIVVQMDEEERIVSEAIQKRFKFTPKVLNGSVSGAAARHKMIADAAADLCFIVKESVGSKGVDMRWTDCIIFYSHRHNTEDYEQMMARNHRGGVKHEKITYVHILCENSYDMNVMKTLQSDLDMAAQIETDWRSLFERD